MTPSKELVALLGFVVLVLHYFKINIVESEIQQLFAAGFIAYGILKGWYDRWQKGEIKLSGF